MEARVEVCYTRYSLHLILFYGVGVLVGVLVGVEVGVDVGHVLFAYPGLAVCPCHSSVPSGFLPSPTPLET